MREICTSGSMRGEWATLTLPSLLLYRKSAVSGFGCGFVALHPVLLSLSFFFSCSNFWGCPLPRTQPPAPRSSSVCISAFISVHQR